MKKSIRESIKKIKLLYYICHGFRLKHNSYKEKIKKQSYQKYGKEILKQISKIIIDNNFKCVCTEGTLLGLVRDNQIIPWDDDLDFTIIDTPDFKWDNLENIMLKSGFWKYRKFEDREKIVTVSFKKKHVLCDFTLWENSKDMIDIIYGCYELPELKYINGQEQKYRVWCRTVPSIKEIVIKQFGSITTQIPSNYNEILNAIYGDKWKIPDPNFCLEKEETVKVYKATYYKKLKLLKGVKA